MIGRLAWRQQIARSVCREWESGFNLCAFGDACLVCAYDGAPLPMRLQPGAFMVKLCVSPMDLSIFPRIYVNFPFLPSLLCLSILLDMSLKIPPPALQTHIVFEERKDTIDCWYMCYSMRICGGSRCMFLQQSSRGLESKKHKSCRAREKETLDLLEPHCSWDGASIRVCSISAIFHPSGGSNALSKDNYRIRDTI